MEIKKPPQRCHVAIAAAIFVASGVIGSIRLTSPFEYYHENVTACYANWGRNSLRFGYSATSGAPIRAVGITPESGPLSPRQLYTHRPPFVTLLVSLACRLFGPTEGAVRGVGLVASLATLAAFGALAIRLLGPSWGLVASAFFAFIPNFAFYGIAIAHQTFGVLGALLIIMAAFHWQDKPGRGRLALLLGVVALTSWFDWPAFYGAGSAGLLILLTGREKRWVGFLIPATAVMSLGVFVFYLYRLDPVGLEAVKDFLSTGASHSDAVPLGNYLAAHVREAVRWFTIPVLFLGAIGAGQLRPRSNPADAAILATAILGADSILFSKLTHGHLFMTVPLVPFAALAATRGFRFLAAWKWTRIAAGALALGFVVQSGLTLTRAHSAVRFPYYCEASRALASALKQTASPVERTLVRLYVDKHVLGYYADRPIALYSTSGRTLEWLDAVRLESGIDDAAIIRILEQPEPPFSWVVTTTYAAGAEVLPSLRPLPQSVSEVEAFVQKEYDFENERLPSPLMTWLRSRHSEIRREGFLFFDLRKRR